MNVTIADIFESKISNEKNVALLFGAVLCAEDIISSTYVSTTIDYLHSFKQMSEKVRFEHFLQTYKRNGVGDDVELRNLENVYKKIKQYRQLKFKNKEEIITLQRLERFVKSIMDTQYSAIKRIEATLKIEALEPFTDKARTKPLVIFTFADENTALERIDTRFNFISKTLTDESSLVLFDFSINDYFKSAELEKINVTVNEIDFISDFLFEFPSPLNLSSGQISLVRIEMSNVQWKFFDALEKVNSEAALINFEKQNFNSLCEKYTVHASSFKTLLQKNIDEMEILNDLKKQETDKPLWKLYAGISSYANIIKMYRALEMFNQETELYIKEDLAERTELDKSSVFLYLKCDE